MTSLERMELHADTLHICNAHGDLLTSADPFEPCRRRARRLYLAWNDTTMTHRFRDDVAPDIRDAVEEWASQTTPSDLLNPESMSRLAEIFSTPLNKINTGPAYSSDHPVEPRGDAALLTRENASALREDFLQPGEIDTIHPSFAVIIDGKAVSTCLTVRRHPRAIEAGVDTIEAYRGNGYAVDATTAWINATLELGLVPFYSTSSDNTASQRVAEKSGLTQFAMELGIP